MATKKQATPEGSVGDTPEPAKAAPKRRGAAAIADALLEAGGSAGIGEHADNLLDDKPTVATQSARVLSEVISRKPAAVASYVDRFVAGIRSPHKRVVQTSAEALPAITKVAPARVAKHLEKLTGAFEDASDTGKDGLVQTFAALCAASVAYQKRLEPVLKIALGSAEGKTLVTWTETVLPALKGEPHANARAVVESRLMNLPKAPAQKIADFLGIKLRLRRR